MTLIIVPSGDCNLNPIDLGTGWESWTDNVTNSTKSFDPDGFVTFNDDGTATVPKQDAWVSGTYGQASVEGGGPVYDCADLIILDLEHTVAAGSFGVGTISFQLI